MVTLAANLGTARSSNRARTIVRTTGPLMQKARNLFGNKSVPYLADITGYSLDTCESWLGGRRKIPADALAALIRSDWGLEFVIEIMADSRASWWTWVLGLIGVVRRRAADRRLLEQSAKADRELATAIARAEAALLVQDEDFHRPYLDALGAAAAPAHAPADAQGRTRARTMAARRGR